MFFLCFSRNLFFQPIGVLLSLYVCVFFISYKKNKHSKHSPIINLVLNCEISAALYIYIYIYIYIAHNIIFHIHNKFCCVTVIEFSFIL